MIEIYDTKLNYSLDNILEEENVAGEMLRAKKNFSSDPDNFIIKENKVEITMNNKNIVWGRSYDNIENYIQEIEGNIYFYSYPTQEEITRKEVNKSFLISTGTINVGYWNADPIIGKSYNFLKYEQDSADVLTKNRYLSIESNLVFAIETSLFTVLKSLFPDREVVYKKDCILIDKKSVMSSAFLRNSYGVFNNVCIMYDYDDELYRSLLTERDYKGITGNTFSGLKQFGLTLTEEEFIELWKNEMYSSFDRAEIIKERIAISASDKVLIK